MHALIPVMSVNYLLHRKQTTYSTFTADSEWLYIWCVLGTASHLGIFRCFQASSEMYINTCKISFGMSTRNLTNDYSANYPHRELFSPEVGISVSCPFTLLNPCRIINWNRANIQPNNLLKQWSGYVDSVLSSFMDVTDKDIDSFIAEAPENSSADDTNQTYGCSHYQRKCSLVVWWTGSFCSLVYVMPICLSQGARLLCKWHFSVAVTFITLSCLLLLAIKKHSELTNSDCMNKKWLLFTLIYMKFIPLMISYQMPKHAHYLWYENPELC